MAKIVNKRSKKKESNKVKLKSAKTILPKGQNITDTNYKVKKVIIRDQVHIHAGGEIVNKKNLSCQELINRLTHHNVSMKNDALAGLKELVARFSKEIYGSNLMQLISSISKLTLDESSNVRKEANKLLAVILSQVSIEQIVPLFSLLSSYLICGLTHIDSAVREDSLFFLDVLLKNTPDLCAKFGPKLLPVCLDLVSSGASGARTLSVNLESKFTSGKWRVSVLARISALLSNILTLYKENELSCSRSLSKNTYRFPEDVCHQYYFSLIDENLKHDYDENRLYKETSNLLDLTKEFRLKEFSEALIPLLFEAFVELVPVEKSAIERDSSTTISCEEALFLKHLTSIMNSLLKLCSLSSSPVEDQHWMKKKFGKSFIHSVIENRYPYSLVPSMEQSKKKKNSNDSIDYRDLPSEHTLNILLATLLINLTTSINWKPALAYLKHCLRMTETFSVDESSLLVSCFQQICCHCSENSKEFLVALVGLSSSKNNFLSSLAFTSLHRIAVEPSLSHLHDNENFISWLDSLPEKLTRTSISSKLLDIIYDIAKRNFSGFSTSLDGYIEVILDNLAFLKIDGHPDNEKRLKVAQLLYWVKDWDSEMVEALNNGVKNSYWGTSVSSQIRDILLLKNQLKEGNCH